MTAAVLSDTRAPGQETFFKLALACCVCAAGLEVGYLLYSPMPYDMQGYLVGRDFANTWVGAKLAVGGNPAPFFGYQAYSKLLAETFHPGLPVYIWSYPPHILLLNWPWAFLPYLVAYVLYCLIGLIAYVAIVGDGERRASHLLLLALSPAVVVNIWNGQNGFIISILLLGGLLQLERRPVLAGVMFGVLSIKPQFGLLLPIVLMLTGRWRTITAAAVTVITLVGATTAIYGTSVWTAYWYDAMPIQRQVVLDGYSYYMALMPTAFMNAKVAGLSLAAAAWWQTAASLATAVAVIWTFMRRRDPDLSLSLLITASFTVTPYAFNYDMVLLSGVIVRLMDRTDHTRLDYGLMLVVWIMPVLTIPFGMMGIPISFAAVFAFGGRLVWRMWRTERETIAEPEFASALPQAS